MSDSENYNFELPEDFDPANNLIHAQLLTAVTMANMIPALQVMASELHKMSERLYEVSKEDDNG